MPKRGPYAPAKAGDRRRSEYRKQALREQMAQRPIDRDSGKILPELQDSLAPAGPRSANSRTRDFDPSPTDALEPGDLGAPILLSTPPDVERAQGSSRLQNKQEAGGRMRAESAQDTPHIDLTSTRGIAEFDLTPRPVQAVPLSMKQVHPARAQRAQAHSPEAVSITSTLAEREPGAADLATILRTIPQLHDHSGAAIPWTEQNSLAAAIVESLRAQRPEAAKTLAARLMMQGRISRAELLAYVSKHLV